MVVRFMGRMPYSISFLGQVMLAVARACIPEAVRGLATSVSIWAAKQDCKPVLTCPEFPRLPDCICQGDQRVCPTLEQTVCGGVSWGFGIAIFIAGFCLGLGSKFYYDRHFTTVGRPVAAAGEQIAQDESPSDEWLRQARQNKLQLKIRNGAGNR